MQLQLNVYPCGVNVDNFSVYPGTVCVLIQVEIEDGNGTYTEEFHITSRKVNRSTQKPIYKLVGGNQYIYYRPDAYGWRIGDIDGNNFGGFYEESKNIIIQFLYSY